MPCASAWLALQEAEGGGLRVTAVVRFVEYPGTTLLLHAPDFPSGTPVIEAKASEAIEPDPMEVSIDPARFNLFDEAGRAIRLVT